MSVFSDHRNYVPGSLLFPKHLLLYTSLTLLMLIAELFGGNWWYFWPMMALGRAAIDSLLHRQHARN